MTANNAVIFLLHNYEQAYKPGSVLDDHLSNRVVTDTFKPYIGKMPSRLNIPKVASDRVYTEIQLPSFLCALTAHFHTYSPKKESVYFLLHCPWSRLRRPLAGIPLCEARTFLTRICGRDRPAYSLNIIMLFTVSVKC